MLDQAGTGWNKLEQATDDTYSDNGNHTKDNNIYIQYVKEI